MSGADANRMIRLETRVADLEAAIAELNRAAGQRFAAERRQAEEARAKKL